MLRSDVVPNVILISSIFFVDKDFLHHIPQTMSWTERSIQTVIKILNLLMLGATVLWEQYVQKSIKKCSSRFSIYSTLSKISQIGKSEMITQTPNPSHVGRHFSMLPKF